METANSIVIKNAIAFVLGIVLIGYEHIHDANQVYYALIGGYIVLSLYHAWRFGINHYGDFFSLVIFWFLPFAFERVENYM